MKICAIQCPRCLTVVYSRATHDYHSCKCRAVAADGGRDYMKIAYVDTMPIVIELEVPHDRDSIFNDWNYHLNKFGLINCPIPLESRAAYRVTIEKGEETISTTPLQTVRSAEVQAIKEGHLNTPLLFGDVLRYLKYYKPKQDIYLNKDGTPDTLDDEFKLAIAKFLGVTHVTVKDAK